MLPSCLWDHMSIDHIHLKSLIFVCPPHSLILFTSSLLQGSPNSEGMDLMETPHLGLVVWKPLMFRIVSAVCLCLFPSTVRGRFSGGSWARHLIHNYSRMPFYFYNFRTLVLALPKIPEITNFRFWVTQIVLMMGFILFSGPNLSQIFVSYYHKFCVTTTLTYLTSRAPLYTK